MIDKNMDLLALSHAGSWKCVFKSIHIPLKSHICYTTVNAVYAPTDSISSAYEANQPLEDFYNELHSVLATILPTDMIAISGDFNACVGTDTKHLVFSPWSAWSGSS